MTTHLIGLDLGQSIDYSAAAVLKRVFTFPGLVRGRAPEPGSERLHHEVVALLRWKLGTPYDLIVQNVSELMGRVKADIDCDSAVLIVDNSGVGRPVVDLLRRKHLVPRAVTITGGSSVSEREDDMTVPKSFIASAFIIAAQNGTLKVSSKLEFAKELEKEIGAFGYELNRKKMTETYQVQQETVHDDLVIACALPYWYSISKLPMRWSGGKASGATVEDMDYNPLARNA
jgi:hypothetical protein